MSCAASSRCDAYQTVLQSGGTRAAAAGMLTRVLHQPIEMKHSEFAALAAKTACVSAAQG
jgi:putative aminopeptidase FrvX